MLPELVAMCSYCGCRNIPMIAKLNAEHDAMPCAVHPDAVHLHLTARRISSDPLSNVSR